MKILFAVLLIFSHSFDLASGREVDSVRTSIKGKKLAEFIKKYTQTEVDRIAAGRCISIAVPNSEKSDRVFYSVQLFLVKSLDGRPGSVDVFETTSGPKRGDINLLMNITDVEIKNSYIVFREQVNDPHVSQEPKWIETRVQLAQLVPAVEKKS